MPSTHWSTPISRWRHYLWSHTRFPRTRRATSWTAESSRTARQLCRRLLKEVQLALGRTRTEQRRASTAAMAMVEMALPMADSVAQTITEGQPGSASVAYHPAAALPPREASERTTIATAIGHRRGAELAVAPEGRGLLRTRTHTSPATAAMRVGSAETTGHATTGVRPERTAGQIARETTALAEVGLREWSGAITASVSATCTDDRIGLAMRGFSTSVSAACTNDRIRLAMHSRGHDISHSIRFARRRVVILVWIKNGNMGSD